MEIWGGEVGWGGIRNLKKTREMSHSAHVVTQLLDSNKDKIKNQQQLPVSEWGDHQTSGVSKVLISIQKLCIHCTDVQVFFCPVISANSIRSESQLSRSHSVAERFHTVKSNVQSEASNSKKVPQHQDEQITWADWSTQSHWCSTRPAPPVSRQHP